jgi:Putative phage tail protein
MQSAFIAKEQLTADTPLFFFNCTLADGSTQHWSSRSFAWGGTQYEARVVRHNLFEAQLASDTQIGGLPRLIFELANADSRLSEIDQQVGFKGAQLTVQSVFVDLAAGAATTDPVMVFRGLMNPPELVTETTFRLSAMNRMSMQRTVLPNVRVERMCPWRFPATAAQRLEAVDGGPSRGAYSLFYRCGYSPDQPNGVGNMNGAVPFTSCAYTRSDCVQRGMFTADSSGRATARFGGIEYVPPTILVRGAGQKNSSLSAVQQNTASYNDFVPLVYGTQWHLPDVVFSRNDGNLTRMEVLLGMGEIEGILTVLVNDIVIPRGVPGAKMTSTGWYNVITPGARNGKQDPNFADSGGVPLGDPFGSMACLSVVVPNRISDGTSIPSVQVLMQGLKLWQFDAGGFYVGARFSSNPAWVLLDVLMRSGYSFDDIDTGSFAAAAAYADQLIDASDPVGGTVQLPRFQCNFALKQRRSVGDIIRSIRNASRIHVVLNTAGLLEARGENTFALQQPARPAASNAVHQFNGGWPAYEFDAGSIARNSDGSASAKLSSKGAQDTPNRLSIEFQDSFNQFQQDSLSVADEDDLDLCGQEIPAIWDAVGISTFNQASRMLLLGLNRAIEGNLFIEFETSVKALGLLPGDLITVTYLKENLIRTPFRIQKITSGPNFRTAVISAQLHDDAWYGDTVTGIIGGRGRQTGRGSGLPAPVGGTVLDDYGNLQLGITETEVTSSDGSSDVELAVFFTAPGGQAGTLPAPLLGLAPVVSASGGTLSGGLTYFYAISAVDGGGAESVLSFMAQAQTQTESSTNSVILDAIILPVGTESFHVYRGTALGQLARIASDQAPQPTFTDTGLAPQPILPPDPQFDHVNVYWRWELVPETPAGLHSLTTAGNSVLELEVNAYSLAVIRITRGTGAGQERSIAGNTESTITVARPWDVEPDATSFFVISESSWRFGAMGATSPIPIDVPERIENGVQVSARAANVADEEAAYELSPLTRWVIGQSEGLSADSDVPPAPQFGVAVAPSRGGVLEFSGIGFDTFVNTRGVIAGTYRIHFHDEVNGAPSVALSASVAADDQIVRFGAEAKPGTLLQIGAEIVLASETDTDGNTAVQRGLHLTTAESHEAGAPAYPLSEKIAIVPFVKSFAGTPAGGDWKYSLELTGVRVASVELFMTNALGNGAVAVNTYTTTNDQGLRTLAGGQFAFQISGYLAVQTGAAPIVVVDVDRAVRDIYALLATPSSGAGVTLQLNLNGAAYATLEFDPGAATSNLVNGFALPALRAGDHLSLDVAGVGTTNPGSDLTVIMRL